MNAPAPATAPAPDGMVTCSCRAVVKPTRPGGARPRPHLHPDTGAPCAVVHPTETVCKRCGGAPDSPVGGCTSQLFHPQTWTVRGRRVGNAAAAGALLGSNGEYFRLLLRRYATGSASRPPEPKGYDMARRCPYWDLDAVAAWVPTRPVKGSGRASASASG